MSADPPDQLELWTIQTVRDVVQQHQYEPGQFDFKEVLNPTRSPDSDEHKLSIQRTACSMANSDGGVMLFGIKDPRKHPNLDVSGLLVGIPPGDHRKEFGEKVKIIQPELYFETVPSPIRLQASSSNELFVVRIPRSQRRPHMLDGDGRFLRRGIGGHAVRMNIYEVREQMLNTEERLRKVTLLRLDIKQSMDLAKVLLLQGDAGLTYNRRFDVTTIKIVLADICALMPLDGTLERILEISPAAAYINRIYNQASRPLDGQAFRTQAQQYFLTTLLSGALNDLVKLCDDCERRLTAIFGALTS